VCSSDLELLIGNFFNSFYYLKNGL